MLLLNFATQDIASESVCRLQLCTAMSPWISGLS